MRPLRLVLALAATLAGCGASGPVAWRPDPNAPRDHADTVKTWTRHGEAYDDLEVRLLADATLISPAFAHSYAHEEAERLGLSPAETAERVRGRVAQAETSVQILLGLTTTDILWNDLDKARPTLRARLVRGDQQIAPINLRRLDLKAKMAIRAYFPPLTVLEEVYWITFPPRPDNKPITLRIAGAPARLDLRWEFTGD